MHSSAILREVQQLYNVSDRLDSLAEQHSLVSDALITISGSVRNTATLLELLVAMKIAPFPDQIQQASDLLECLASWVWALCAASRGEQYSEVNYELAVRSPHSQ
jgi:hypothetical protein